MTQVEYKDDTQQRRRGEATIRAPYLARLLGTILDRY